MVTRAETGTQPETGLGEGVLEGRDPLLDQVSGTEALSGGELKEQAVRGMFWLGGARLGTQVIDQVFTVLLVRLLAPSDFGLMAMAAVFTSLFRIFSDMGLARAVVQRDTIDEDYLSTAFWGNLLSGIVLCGIGLAGAVLITRVYNEPLVRPVFAVLSLRFIFSGATGAQLAVLTRQMHFRAVTVRNVASVIVAGIVGVGMALAGAGVWSLVGQNLVGAASRFVLLWLVVPWRPKRRFSWAKFRELWAFGGSVLGARTFSLAIKQSDNLLIGRVFGSVLLGYYSFAYGLFFAPLAEVGLIVGRVMFSALSRLQHDRRRLKQGFMLAAKYIVFFSFPTLVGLFLVADDVVGVVFGPKWLPAVPVLKVLLVAGAIQTVTQITDALLQAMGRANWVFRWSVFSACVYVPAFYIGLRWGIVGVAVGYTVSTFVLLPIEFWLVRRLTGLDLRDYATAISPIVMASAVMVVCVVLAQAWLTSHGADPALRLVGAMGVGATTFLGAVWVIQRKLITELMRTVASLRRSRPHILAEEMS